MLVSVINLSHGDLSDEELQAAVRAINRQIAEDFTPEWGLNATLRLEGTSSRNPPSARPDDMRGDAVIYVFDGVDASRDDGAHGTFTKSGVPYASVFLGTSKLVPEDWTVTLSHEALELILNPQRNLLAIGPDPRDHRRHVLHWYEACDAVQAESYAIDGIAVSNFVLPLYFTQGDERRGRNDFLGRRYGGRTLRSFGINPGGYLNFYAPKPGELAHAEQYFPQQDATAAARVAARHIGGIDTSARYRR